MDSQDFSTSKSFILLICLKRYILNFSEQSFSALILTFYFQRALIARNRLKRQAMAKPVLSEQEVNTIKERKHCFCQHNVTISVTIPENGIMWFYLQPIYEVSNVFLAKIITSSHLNAFDLTFGSLLNQKSSQFSSFIFKSQGIFSLFSVQYSHFGPFTLSECGTIHLIHLRLEWIIDYWFIDYDA